MVRFQFCQLCHADGYWHPSAKTDSYIKILLAWFSFISVWRKEVKLNRYIKNNCAFWWTQSDVFEQMTFCALRKVSNQWLREIRASYKEGPWWLKHRYAGSEQLNSDHHRLLKKKSTLSAQNNQDNQLSLGKTKTQTSKYSSQWLPKSEVPWC